MLNKTVMLQVRAGQRIAEEAGSERDKRSRARGCQSSKDPSASPPDSLTDLWSCRSASSRHAHTCEEKKRCGGQESHASTISLTGEGRTHLTAVKLERRKDPARRMSIDGSPYALKGARRERGRGELVGFVTR